MKSKKLPVIRFIFRGPVRLSFLIKGKCPPGWQICKAQSKNPKHKGWKLVTRIINRPIFNSKQIVHFK